jgi:hypothetical protein
VTSRPPRIGLFGCTVPAGRLARGVLCVALVSGLAACSFLGGGGSGLTPGGGSSASTLTPSPSPAPVADPVKLAGTARTAGTPAHSGKVTLTVAAFTPPVTVTAQGDGSAAVSLGVVAVPASTTGTPSREVAAVFAAPAGLQFEARSDGSAAVLGGSGAVVGALTRAGVVGGAGVRRDAELAVRKGDPGLADLLVDAGPAGTATLVFGADPLVREHWTTQEGGRSLAVVPAPWVRTGGLAAQDALWSALVAAEPAADLATMHDQMLCHALGAPDKASWNLEPWRPKVDSLTMLAAGCNP